MCIKRSLLVLLIVLSLFGCDNADKKTDRVKEESTNQFTTQLLFSKNLKITREKDVTRVKVIEPFKGANQSLEYVFVPKTSPVPAVNKKVTVIRTPVDRLVCTSTTFLPSLEMLGAAETLVGFPSTQYISSTVFTDKVKSGQIVDLGRDSNINIELLLELEPEVVITYTVAGLSDNYDQISRSGIPVAIGAGYLEEEPLGRAEWIKFIALFLGKEKEADSVFNEIRKNYEEVLSAVQSADETPTVLTSTVYKDVWYMPGGNSWAGKYFKSAGADYLWKDSPESGSIELSFESVYDQALDAEYWIGTDGYNSFSALIKADTRYKSFSAFQNGNVYSYNKRITASGGNDYFESGIARPDLVLKDIVKILHPDLFPGYELYFYEKLTE